MLSGRFVAFDELHGEGLTALSRRIGATT